MKKLIMSSLLLFCVVGFSGCTSSKENVESAQDDVKKADEALKQATKEYQEDMKAYRIETQEKIDANNKKIAELRLNAANKKESVRNEHLKGIEELERKNNQMKTKLDDYRDDGREKWERFKKEFGEDMNELGEALKGFGQSED